MKARFSSSFVLGLALSALPFVGACTPQSADQTSFISTANAEPAVAVTTTNAPTEAVVPVTSPPVAADPDTVVPVPAPAAVAVADGEKKLPANLKPTSPAGEVIKLAQAGVEESVMLTYITNTTSMFNLGSDEIIYLNDLGVASNVITAMLQHDQGLKTFWANQAAPAVAPPAAVQPAETVEAAAPSYVNPPQAETQPALTEPAPIVNNNYFYDTLSPYGTWVEIEGYGRCWQPTVVVVNRGWRPYADRGRWVYTDCGWYWMSDYSWGATTFHYGRWFSHPRYGWCWWPDRVWAPSWVSFRYSGDYCGWAPLPPHAYYRPGLGFSYYGRSVGFGFDFGLGAGYFTFVSWNNFCDSRPWHHRVPHHQATQIYNHTTIVNNYVTGDNNTVINRGIGRDRVRELSRTEIKTVKLRDAEPGRSPGGGRSERFDRDGSTLVVNRPQFAETRGSSTGATERPARPGLATPRGGGNLDAPKTESGPITRPVAREHNEVGRGTRVPVTTSPAPTVTPTPTAPKPESRPTREREVPGGRGGRPITTTPAPIIANDSPSTVPSVPPKATAPAKTETRSSGPVSRPTTPNLIVIGKRENNAAANPTAPTLVAPQVAAPTPRNVPSQSPASRPQRLAEATGSTQTWTAPTTAPARPEAPNVSRSISSPAPIRSQTPTYTPPAAPTYSAPVSRPTPGYTPRVLEPAPVRSYSPPAVSAPRPTPSVSAPSYSAPRPTPSAPAPSYNSRPAPSAPTPSYSAPRSSSSESRSSSSSGSRSEGGRRER